MDVFQGYLWKKGHLRRNWTERWFCLKPGSLSYFTSEDCRDCKGVIEMDQNCCVEVRRSSLRLRPERFCV
uniref:PH domain-containing protein n=1 Tax=Sinocyclocheilus rhinocerous TaxID=307959 RepID=A0A673LWU3_9TELE